MNEKVRRLETDIVTAVEAENRIRNLMWTVSGDYKLDTKLDVESYFKSRFISLYDAVKQGGFAKYFDQNAMAMYLVKKIYYGAEEKPLTDLAQLCVDAAVWKKISKERPGIPELRRRAFEDLLEFSYEKLCGSLPGRLRAAMMQEYLYGRKTRGKQMDIPLSWIRSLEEAEEVMELIRTVDRMYNTMIDLGFERKHGDLEHVLAADTEDLKEFNWKDFLEETAVEYSLEEYLKQITQRLLTSSVEEREEEKEKKSGGRRVVVLDQEALDKMYSYMELNYGRSYLTPREQKQQNYRLCRGAHADCSLYFTEGILRNPVLSNAQYVNAKRHAEKNRLLFRNSYYMLKRNIELLTGELKRSLVRRQEPEWFSSDYGTIVPARLWKVGRLPEPGKLFVRTNKRDQSEFVVDILMDASGSQRDRQGQVALQAYIISEALSNNGIPHRIMGFCTFWDYTVMQRFREYDDPRSENQRVLDFVTSANNRDGLAIRAAGDGLLRRPEENKILIVLSDGRPNDVIVNRPGSRNPRPYQGEYAVRDTAYEVRKLRGEGVYVLGVFAGKEKDLAAEKKIFGKDFAYIREIANFSRVTGRYLRRLLDWEGV